MNDNLLNNNKKDKMNYSKKNEITEDENEIDLENYEFDNKTEILKNISNSSNILIEKPKNRFLENSKLQKNSQFKKIDTAPFIMTIDIDNNKTGKIKLFPDSNPAELAFEFCKNYCLDFETLNYLTNEIDQILRKNYTDFKKSSNASKELMNECIEEVDNEEDNNTEVNKLTSDQINNNSQNINENEFDQKDERELAKLEDNFDQQNEFNDNYINVDENQILFNDQQINNNRNGQNYNNNDKNFKGFANKGLLVNSDLPLSDGVYFFIIKTYNTSGADRTKQINKGYLILKR